MWQAYDLLAVCVRIDIDPRDYDNIKELMEAVSRTQAKEQIRLKKLSEGSYGS
jgi:hypothetical protein